MNKLSFEKVKELFKSKYKEGNIYKKEGGSYYITFKEGGKIYIYKAKNNLQLLRKLNLQVQTLYLREYKALKKEREKIKKELLLGFIPGDENWGTKDHPLSIKEKEEKKQRVEEIKQVINESIII